MTEAMRIDRLLTHAGELISLNPEVGEGPLGILRDAAVAIRNGRIAWLGSSADASHCLDIDEATEIIDLNGRVLTPGLIDCHTHLVFGGGREHEFELRVAGATYEEIAASGGGILSTMQATREADVDELYDSALHRLGVFLSHGVTTCEIKSGYGLDLPSELKMLEVIRMLKDSQPMTIVSTFLGAHALPPEYRDKRETYVECIIDDMLPKVAERELADFCDVFCESGAFSVDESRRILARARELGMKIRIHADQLSASGGARLAAELGASSADHLEHATPDALKAMADAGTVAVLLPGAAFYLGQPFPSLQPFREAGVLLALSTDFNPGSSPSMNLPLMGSIAAVRMGMSCAEAMRAMTLNAAHALGLEHTLGSVQPGKNADLAVFNVRDHRTIFYNYGMNHCTMVFKDGELIHPLSSY